MESEGCDKSASISSSSLSYTAFTYIGQDDTLCTQSREMIISARCQCPGGTLLYTWREGFRELSWLVWLVFKAEVVYNHENMCGPEKPLSAGKQG